MTAEPNPQPPAASGRLARIDVIGGAVMIFMAALIWYGAIELEVGHITNFGSGALPRVLAGLLLLAGGWVFIHGLLQPEADAEGLRFAVRPTAIVVLAIVLFGLFIRGGTFGPLTTPQLGLMVVGPLTVFIAGCATPQLQPKQLLVLSLGLTAAMLLLFGDLLSTPIPVFPRVVQNAIPPAFGIDAAVRVLYLGYGAVAVALHFVFFGLPGDERG